MTAEDPLLAALADAAKRKEQSDHQIRLLLAYAREHVQPRPYRLADLAQAAGMSLSGIRTAYTQADIDQAAALTGGARSRHRIQKVCFETRMHTRSGRLPLVLRIHPTQVGERALIWCRAGICGADFEAHTPEIAAACYARQARVEGNKRWAQLVQLDIVRRDTLGAHNVIPSGVVRLSPKWKKAS